METLTATHSQEISRFSSQQHSLFEKTSFSTENSRCVDDNDPVLRKKVSKASKQACGNSLFKSSTCKESNSKESSQLVTPVKQVGLRDVTNRDNATTLKKGLSQQLEVAFPPTVNKNKHAAKNNEGTQYVIGKGSQKLTKTPWFGKRNFFEYDDKEKESLAREEETDVSVVSEEVKNETVQEIKKVKVEISLVEKKKVVEQIYHFNHTRNEMNAFPVYLDKELGYGQFIQETLKETEVDNDCQTDTEVMHTVKKWTMDDLAEGIQRHLAEKANDLREKEKMQKENEAEEKFKKILEDYQGFDSEDESENHFGGFLSVSFVKDSKDSKETTKNSKEKVGFLKKILENI